ncbi:MAG: phage portal protein [Candidatus Peribacteria bacterium]|nr:phage portal protein [Candidatus Peribacteria bacterium]
MPAEKVTELEAKRNNKYQGKHNAHKTALLVGGMELKTVQGFSQQQLDYVLQRRLSRDEILSMFKVPKAILGLGEGSNALNTRPFETIYARRTIKPLAIKVAERLSYTLFKDIGYFEFINVVPIDDAEVRSNYQSGMIMLNEARSKIGERPLK